MSISGCATTAPAPQRSVATIPAVPPAMQWLYGSGEGAAASIQAYHGMLDYVLAAARARPASGVVLAEGSTLEHPSYVTCANKPLAVVLDVDETALQNLGYEYYEARIGGKFDSKAWDAWERTGADKVLPMPGAVTALRNIRLAGVRVIFNSNREAVNAAATEAALDNAGLGPARHRDTLYLSGDDAMGSAKDGRRARIAERYCVLAMAGDQLGDFSDLFNAKTISVTDRRAAAGGGAFADKWGNGWFMLPNPVYGPGLRGGLDDVFPADRQWSPGEGEK